MRGILLRAGAGAILFSALSLAADVETHRRAAQHALQANQPDVAIHEYQAVLAADPQNLDAHANLGTLLFFKGAYDQALPQLRAALQLKPELWKLAALLGMSEKRAGDSHAQTDLEAAFSHLTEDRIRVQIGMELIEIYYASRDLNKAAGVAGVLRQLMPADPDVLYTAHRIYSDLADETTLAMVMTDSDSARMHQIMGQELARHGQTEAAISQYREALKLGPQMPGIHFELAELLAGSTSKPEQEIEQQYQAALAANPMDQKSECRLGEIAFRHSDLKAAYDHFARAVALAPDDGDANLGLGKTLVSMHEPQKATPLLERAVKAEPYSSVAHYRLAQAYRATGRAGEAESELAQFQKFKTMKERLGQVYKGMMLKPRADEAADPDIPKESPLR